MAMDASELVGRIVGGYQLERIIGSGGAGTVYLGTKVGESDQQVAVKVLMPPPQASATDRVEFKARFEREAKALQLLRHPRILALLEYGEDEASGLSYMVLPYMSGGTLASRLQEGAQPLDDVARYTTEIGEALDYAHSQGIVHRDVKPGNVLLDANGQIYLADFGIAKIFDTAGTTLLTITSTGQVMGTADYMSPEQAQGEDVTGATDVYSLGMVLYHLVTGKVPFEGKSLTQILLQIATTPPIPPRSFRPTLPAPAEAAILRALAKKPVDRFKSAGELSRAFSLGLRDEWAPGLRQAETIAGFTPQPTVVAPGNARPRRQGRRQLLVVAVSALLLLAVVGTLAATGAAAPLLGSAAALFAKTSASPTATSNDLAPTTTTTTSTTSTTTTAPTATRSSGGGAKPTATRTPKPTATLTPPHLFVDSSQATIDCKQTPTPTAYRRIGNTGQKTLTWSIDTSQANGATPSPASGTVAFDANVQIMITGSPISGSTGTLTVNSNGGSAQINVTWVNCP
jgi:serine/threonine protein kinase